MITITYKLAHAAAQDEGNRNMRKYGRETWNEDDYNKAVDTLNRLYPVEIEIPESLLKAPSQPHRGKSECACTQTHED